MYFEKKEEAEKHFTQFITLYEDQNGQNGKADWSKEEHFVKLKTFADGCITELKDEGGEEEEYYDEEEEK